MDYCTYLITYSGSELPPFYIGSTSKKRVATGYLGSVSSRRFRKAWKDETRLYPKRFCLRILTEHSTRKEALAHEAEIQEALDVVRDRRFVNCSIACTNGFFGMDVSGEAHPMFGKTHSAKTRRKMSENWATGRDKTAYAHRMREIGKINGKINGKLPCPESHKQRLRELKTGIPLSIEHRQLISDATKKALANPAVRAKLSAKAKGRKRSAESIAATAALHTGMKRSKETKAKLRAAWQRRKQLKENLDG